MRTRSNPDQEDAAGTPFCYRNGATPSSPLVILVHGRAGTLDVMWTFERTIPADHAIISLQAPHPDPIGGFSWWLIDQVSSISDAAQKSVFAASGMVTRILDVLGLGPEKRIGIGFSQGAALLSYAWLTKGMQLDAVGLLAGFVVVPESGITRHGGSVFMAHGTTDDVVRIDRARNGAAILEQNGCAVRYVEDEVGHKVGIQGMKELKNWLETVC